MNANTYKLITIAINLLFFLACAIALGMVRFLVSGAPQKALSLISDVRLEGGEKAEVLDALVLAWTAIDRGVIALNAYLIWGLLVSAITAIVCWWKWHNPDR